ncbi:hypothetical protein MPSEU_000370600 [Mayamaea pseudoterrestris]|nr:hypothetical protein MPSEU_000370600 [Mayamaea pseudoterrestris]
MNALLKKANEVGVSEKDAKSTLGGFLSFIKSKTSEEQYQMIVDKIPGASDLVQDTEAARATGNEGSGDGDGNSGGGGGFMGMASSLMTKFQQDGGSVNSIPELLAFLKAKGVNEKEIMKYLPEIAKVVKQKTGIDISSYIGAGGSSASGDAAAAATTSN